MTISTSDAPLETHPFFIYSCVSVWDGFRAMRSSERGASGFSWTRLVWAWKFRQESVKSNRRALFSLSQLVPSDSSDFFVTHSSKQALSVCRSARRHVAHLSAEWKHRLWKTRRALASVLCCELSHLTHLLTVNLFFRETFPLAPSGSHRFILVVHTQNTCAVLFLQQRYLWRRFPNCTAPLSVLDS